MEKKKTRNAKRYRACATAPLHLLSTKPALKCNATPLPTPQEVLRCRCAERCREEMKLRTTKRCLTSQVLGKPIISLMTSLQWPGSAWRSGSFRQWEYAAGPGSPTSHPENYTRRAVGGAGRYLRDSGGRDGRVDSSRVSVRSGTA